MAAACPIHHDCRHYHRHHHNGLGDSGGVLRSGISRVLHRRRPSRHPLPPAVSMVSDRPNGPPQGFSLSKKLRTIYLSFNAMSFCQWPEYQAIGAFIAFGSPSGEVSGSVSFFFQGSSLG